MSDQVERTNDQDECYSPRIEKKRNIESPNSDDGRVMGLMMDGYDSPDEMQSDAGCDDRGVRIFNFDHLGCVDHTSPTAGGLNDLDDIKRSLMSITHVKNSRARADVLDIGASSSESEPFDRTSSTVVDAKTLGGAGASARQNSGNYLLDLIDEKFIKEGVMYLCRVNSPNFAECRYVLGYTQNLTDELSDIDERLACERRMELLTLKFCDHQNVEVVVRHQILMMGCDIRSGTYDVSKKIYDHMLTDSEYVNPFYTIDNASELYLGQKITKQEHTTDRIFET